MKDRVGGNRPGFGGRAEYLPAAIVLAGVSVFWIVGLLGGLRVLHSPGPALTVLIWLYVMLAAVALSIVAAALATIDITRRLRRRRHLQEADEEPPFHSAVLPPVPQPRMREAAPPKRDPQPPTREPSVQPPKPEPSVQLPKREPSEQAPRSGAAAQPPRGDSTVRPPRRDSYARKDEIHSRTG